MVYNYNFAICAAVFNLMVILYYFYRRRLPDYISKIFSGLMIVCFIHNMLDIISGCVISNASVLPYWLCMLVNSLFYTCQALFAVFTFIYALAATGKLRLLRMTTLVELLIPAIFQFWLIVTNPLTFYLFTFSDSGEYIYGPLRIVQYIIPLIYLVMVACTAIKYRLYIGKAQLATLIMLPIIMIASAGIQFYTPEQLVIGAGSIATVLMLYLALQNPNERLDALTGHFNSNAFTKFCEQQFADRRIFYFLGIKINNLKMFNSIMGVENCDRMINVIGDFLYHIPERCLHFKISNGVFAIITYQEEKFGGIIKYIDERFQHPWKIDEVEVKVDISISCMEVPKYASSLESILSNMEYCSTKIEGNPSNSNFLFIDEAMMRDIDHSMAIERALESAIREKRFDVVYQPIFSIKERKMVSAEALVRLYDPVIGNIPPDVFIPMAEKNGSILKIGNIVLTKVCEFISINKPENFGIKKIGINLSAVECMQENLNVQIASIMKRYGVDPDAVYLEITETAAVNSYERLRETMDGIIEVGTSFALDDYGTGYLNLDSIIKLPFKIIKIDKSLIWSYEENNNSHVILTHLIAMAKDLGMKVLIEGVETDDQKQLVERIGADYIQGYYFSKPLKPADFLHYLTQYRQTHSKK